MVGQLGSPKSSKSKQQPDSPFLDEELFADVEVETAEAWASRLVGYQLESPFQYAFEPEQESFLEPEVEEFEEELYDEEEVDEYEFDDDLYDEGEDFDENEFGEALPEILEAEAAISSAGSSGVSSIAIPSIKQWPSRYNRPAGWQGRVYGLVVHTTGSGAPKRARREGISPTEWAVRYYKRSRGCHYVNGWSGMAGGDLIQVANERFRAWGVGVTNKDEPSKDQRRSIRLGRFEKDLPSILVALWRKRWPNYKHSLELLPRTRTANSCYVHVECLPCVYHGDKGLATGAEPLRAGLRFTKAQHDTVAHLAVDIARRNGWPAQEAWWRTPRLLGHEDLTPIARHDKKGGWDPGYLREKPYFDWDYVYGMIGQILQRGPGEPRPGSPAQPISTLFSALGSLVKRFLELIASGQERLAIALAYQQGITDENKLTNLVFFARHPELGGRRIRSDEKELAREWLQIRNQLVRPALPDRYTRELFLDELNQEAISEALQEETELAEAFVGELEDESSEDFLNEWHDEEFNEETEEEALAQFFIDEEEELEVEGFPDESEDKEFNEEVDEEAFAELLVGEAEELEAEEFFDELDDKGYATDHEAPSVEEVTFPSGESLPIISGSDGRGQDYYDPHNSGNPLLDTSSPYRSKHLTKNFTVGEFAKSGGKRFDRARIDPKLIRCLQTLRDHLGKPVRITSGYRSYQHNEYLWNSCEERKKRGESCIVSKTSQHLSGRAADIKVAGMTGLELAKAVIDACGCDISIGVGSNYIHIDVRNEPGFWGYGKNRKRLEKAIEDYHQKRCPQESMSRASTLTSSGAQAINVDKAVRLNRHYSRKLGWDYDQIRQFFGFGTMPDQRHLAMTIAQWQQSQGLEVDGIIGPNTWARMQAVMGIGPTPAPVVTSGSGDVRQNLIILGYDIKPDSGTEALRRALREFQRDVGLRRSGELDARTEAKLQGLISALQNAAERPKAMRHMSRFRLTTYYVANESDFPHNPIIPVLDKNGQVIARVDPAFFLSMSVEGSGKLRDGRLLNVFGSKRRGGRQDVTDYPEYSAVLDVARRRYKRRLRRDRIEATGVRLKNGRVASVLAFHEVREKRLGKGYGTRRGIAHDPFHTLAADIGAYSTSEPRFRGKKGGLVPPGTQVFILELAGVQLPDGSTHNGRCVVNDTGGKIFGAHFDVFTGSRAWSKQVSLPRIGHVWFDQSEERCPPDYVYGLYRK